MRNLKINESTIYICKYMGVQDCVDEDGYKTGESTIKYSKPIEFRANISGARGNSQIELFGTDINYDKSIVMSQTSYGRLHLPKDSAENSVLFVDMKPKYDSAKNPLYNYIIKRIAETKNEVAIAIQKVSNNVRG